MLGVVRIKHILSLFIFFYGQDVFAMVDPFENKVSKAEVYGGTQAALCSFPSVVMLEYLAQGNAYICSGTLVHPSIVVYAGHCTENIRYIYFGESIGRLSSGPYSTTASNLVFYDPGPSRTVVPKQCKVYPGHDPYGGTDYAYCLLAEPVTDVPIVPILMGCEQNVLIANQLITLVGFGYDEQNRLGIKQSALLSLTGIVGRKALTEPSQSRGVCNGDSGGPAFVQIKTPLDVNNQYQSSWRVFGITSYGSEPCGGFGVDDLMSLAVPWIEADSGIDITPCGDAAGNWQPTSRCGHFPMAPDTASNWAEGCASNDVSGFSSSCGAPYNPPLSLSLSGITSDTTYPENSPVTVAIALEQNSSTTITSLEVSWDGQALIANTSNASTLDSQQTYFFAAPSMTQGNHNLAASVSDALGNRMDVYWSVAIEAVPKTSGCQSFAVDNPWLLVLLALWYGLRGRRSCQRTFQRLAVVLFSFSQLQCQASSASSNELYLILSNANQMVTVANESLSAVDTQVPLPAMRTDMDVIIGSHRFKPTSVYYYYSSSGILNLYFSTESDLCAMFNSYNYPPSAQLLSIQIVSALDTFVVPTDGTFSLTDPNTFATVASNGYPSATAVYYALDGNCSYLGNTVSTSGQIAMASHYTNGGTYVEGSFEKMVLSGNAKILQGNFLALDCNVPEDFDSRASTTGLGCH